MKKVNFHNLCIFIFLGSFLFFTGCGKKQVESNKLPVANRPRVGAYYYFWYPDNFSLGMVRRKVVPKQKPVLGYYHSSDKSVAEQHISWCSRFGIDFLALDYWPSRPKQNAFITSAFLQAKNISDIEFCIFYESWNLGFDRALGVTSFTPEKIDRLKKDMQIISKTFFSHPSYLKIGGRPVLILYLTRTFSGEYEEAVRVVRKVCKDAGFDVLLMGDEVFWEVAGRRWYQKSPVLTRDIQRRRVNLFDAVTAYNPYESFNKNHAGYAGESSYLQDVRHLFSRYRSSLPEGSAFVPGVTPGYNDRACRPREDHYVIPRILFENAEPGSFFRESLKETVLPFMDVRLKLAMITSFNEWNEDTAIEPLTGVESSKSDTSPSKTFFTGGYPYEGFGARYLEIIRDTFVAIAGRVKNEAGEGVPGVIVSVSGDKDVLETVLSDSRGFYRFARANLPKGQYTLRLSDQVKTLVIQVASNETALMDLDMTD